MIEERTKSGQKKPITLDELEDKFESLSAAVQGLHSKVKTMGNTIMHDGVLVEGLHDSVNKTDKKVEKVMAILLDSVQPVLAEPSNPIYSPSSSQINRTVSNGGGMTISPSNKGLTIKKKSKKKKTKKKKTKKKQRKKKNKKSMKVK